jgi:hypothetical protein
VVRVVFAYCRRGVRWGWAFREFYDGWGHVSAAVDEDMMVDEQSISTLRTRAPSFANSAARGRPTTSDLSDISYDTPSQ